MLKSWSASLSLSIKSKVLWNTNRATREKNGDVVVDWDMNVGSIKVTLKQNEQMEDVAGMQTEIERCLVGDMWRGIRGDGMWPVRAENRIVSVLKFSLRPEKWSRCGSALNLPSF